MVARKHPIDETQTRPGDFLGRHIGAKVGNVSVDNGPSSAKLSVILPPQKGVPKDRRQLVKDYDCVLVTVRADFSRRLLCMPRVLRTIPKAYRGPRAKHAGAPSKKLGISGENFEPKMTAMRDGNMSKPRGFALK